MRRHVLFLACVLVVSCSDQLEVEPADLSRPGVLGQGVAHFDATTRELTFSPINSRGALLDSSNQLAEAGAYSCEAVGWNSSTNVLSQNATIINLSSAVTYLSPIELRLTGISPPGVVVSVNTDLINAGCGTSGLLLSSDDGDANGNFDCIWPDDSSNTADDPGWDYSNALGGDGQLSPGEWSGCRFVHFNLTSETNFSFYYEVLGVTDDGWPPPTSIDPVTTPTAVPSQTVSGRCVNTLSAPDQISPPPAQTPATNEISILGGASPVTTGCTPTFPCVDVDGVSRCGVYSASVPLRANQANRLEVFQTLDGSDRNGSQYVDIRHDDIPPTVAATQPANGAVGVSAASLMHVTFSEPMDPATITAGTLFVRRVGGSPEVAAVSLDGSGMIATIDPTTDLADNRTYELVATTGVQDLVGLSLTAEVVASFVTAKAEDDLAPVVSYTQPPHGAGNYDRRAVLTIGFSEPIFNGGSSDPRSPNCADGGTPTCQAIVVEDLDRGQIVPGTRTLNADNTTVTFQVDSAAYDSTGPDPSTGLGCVDGQPSTPDFDLDCATHYRITIATDITDLAGNPLSGEYIVDFSTGIDADTTPPSVEVFLPPPGATGVSTAVNPEVLFSEPIAASTINNTSVSLKRNGVTPVSAVLSVTSDGLLVRLSPLSLLDAGVRYVLFVNNTVTDVAGNRLTAPQNADFTTTAISDTTPPTVVWIDPAADAANVSLGTTVRVGFSEAMDPLSVSAATIILERLKADDVTLDQAVVGVATLSGDYLVATFTPSVLLKKNRLHRVTVTTGVTDAVGNPMTASFASTFRTADSDDVAPCAVSMAPVDGTDIASNVHFAVGFSEAMLPSSVVPGSFELTDGSGLVATTVTLSADGRQALVVPRAALLTGAVSLRLTGALRDYSAEENALNQNGGAAACLPADGADQPTFNFTVVGGGDTTAPTVVSIVPADGATDVSVATDMVVTFSEPMDPSSINGTNIGLLVDGSGSGLAVERTMGPDMLTMTLDPSNLLNTETAYQISVAAGGPRDLAGNALAAGAIATFVTEAATDVTLPYVVSSCPADGDDPVDRNLDLPCNTAYPGKAVIVFSEPILADTVAVGTFRLVENAGAYVDRTLEVTLQADGVTVTIQPNGTLKNNANHQIRITTEVTDTAGNPLDPVDHCGTAFGEHCVDFDT